MIFSSVNRLGFICIPLRGDELYQFLEEIAGLRSVRSSSGLTSMALVLVHEAGRRGLWPARPAYGVRFDLQSLELSALDMEALCVSAASN